MNGFIKTESSFKISEISDIKHITEVESVFSDLCPKKQIHKLGEKTIISFLTNFDGCENIEFINFNRSMGLGIDRKIVKLDGDEN